MRRYCLFIVIISFVFLSSDYQRNPIHKKWRLVAEEIRCFSHDYKSYDKQRDRFDSIKNVVTMQFLEDGSFKSSEGDGKYTMFKDTIMLNLNNKNRAFKYRLGNNKLFMEYHSKESRFVERSILHFE